MPASVCDKPSVYLTNLKTHYQFLSKSCPHFLNHLYTKNICAHETGTTELEKK